MRATAAGKRRSAAKTPKAPIQRAPRERAQSVSQYANMHEHYPHMHIVTVANSHRFEGVDGPTVENFEADGYVTLDVKPGCGIILPPNHALMGISTKEFERREQQRHDIGDSLLNPSDQPQSAKEMEDIIKQTGRAQLLVTKPNISLAEATATLRTRELAEQQALQEMTAAQE